MRYFFYAVGDEKRGPVSEMSLLELFRIDTVTAETLVWREGMPDWRPLGEVFPQWLAQVATTASADAPDSDNAHCAVSGRLLPKADMIRFGDVWVSPESRDVYLQRLQQGLPAPEDEFVPATVWHRFAGSFIDLLVIGGPFVAITVVAALLMPDPIDFENVGTEVVFMGAILVASAAYEIVMTATRGATLGKMAMQTCVVNAQGRKPGWGTASARWGLKPLVPYLPMVGSIYSLVSIIMALVDKPWRRAIHDRGASTRVVQRRR